MAERICYFYSLVLQSFETRGMIVAARFVAMLLFLHCGFDITLGYNTFLNKNSHIDFIDRHILKKFKKCNKFLQGNDDIIVTKQIKAK